MKARALLLGLAAALAAASAGPLAKAQLVQPDERLQRLFARLEEVVLNGDPEAYMELVSDGADHVRARWFATNEVRPGATRVLIRERDRSPFTDAYRGPGVRILLDSIVEFGDRARIATWQVDVRGSSDSWRIVGQEVLTSVEGIYRLSITQSRQYDARDFTIRSEGLQLTLARGSVFTMDVDRGITGLILLGQGVMRFEPAPLTEKGQVRLLTGFDWLETRFDTAFVRVGDFDSRADRSGLVERAVDPRELRRAEAVFREEAGKSFTIDFPELSGDNWSLLPTFSDMVAEVRTRKYGTLTYTRSESMAEDVSLFDRSKQRQIAVYMSADRLAARGRSYSEDEQAEYDVLHYDLDVSFAPVRRVLEGRATLKVKIRSIASNQLTLRLADSLAVRSAVSDRFGRLFTMRVKEQNIVLVSLPATVMQDTDFSVTIAYAGRISPQAPEQETLQLDLPELEDDEDVADDLAFLLSNRTFWYPQSTAHDYATARIRVTLPAGFECLASGRREEAAPQDAELPRRTTTFVADKPLRYLSLFVGRLVRIHRASLALGEEPHRLDLEVYPARSQTLFSQALGERAADIVRFYHSLLGDIPFPSLAIATIRSRLPGGHSPGYFALLSRPPPEGPRYWRNDPAAFDDRPDFFLAHEIAHQWWGQAVGWRNYHEQWLSEGFAQYFAALYLRHRRGDAEFDEVMRQMRRWGLEQSHQGPISLGNRLGVLRSDGRAFRAIVYDKGAAVLDMLRLLSGDEAFFAGIRRFYEESRFKKVGTDEFRKAMEGSTGRMLEPFFDTWVYGATIPSVKVSHQVQSSPSGDTLVIRAEQTAALAELPLVVTVRYGSGASTRLILPMTDAIAETSLPLKGTVRSVHLERHANLAITVKD